jgi:DNA (cytosine-5)-methyltransferase 1
MSESQDASRIYIAADAFCGAGGLSLGLRNAGFRVVAAFDNNPHAIRTYRRNLGNHGFEASILDVTPDRLKSADDPPVARFDLIAGGPPCQGFSVQRRNGDEDPRNSLPLEFLKLIKAVQPPFFLFENVPGIKKRHGEQILQAFIEDAQAAHYLCRSRVLDAVNYGVPQFRKRLFIVGELSLEGDMWYNFPEPTTDENREETKVRMAFRGLPEPPDDLTEHPDIPNHRRTGLSQLNLQRIKLVPQGGGMQDLPEELRVACHRNGPDKIGHRYVYGRLHLDRPAATITARFDSFTRGKFGHPIEHRNITLREGARLQTFPDDFVFEGGQEEIAAQIGNAVPPLLAEALGRSILDAMERRSRGEPPLAKVVQQKTLMF